MAFARFPGRRTATRSTPVTWEDAVFTVLISLTSSGR